ncbi:murein L,D-transpeptidase catalytic domain family protein [Mucilaginibacter sp. ZT4R22]|uniref:Murein L,D-transpeptidase catalytic domain family protein n=1 Tax=Mucilaginibacter pankratovii TaxID=2772110 RepID=A0ABR7WMU8_9SPHI|nr:murein L,D-transpeptidase catalytic domain family protein [Mucilaginibacter pankratovii]MBD1363627.1 murein L,D-transpeptidase catalytic domain family protein [Mucilaginibacter pankratovii]
MKPKPSFALLLALLWCLTALAETPHIDLTRTREKAKQALLFSKERGYNSRYCILIDMSLPSGVKRFMVWDFKKNNAITSGLVSHGCGRSPWSGEWSKDTPAFSNADGSHCTALGKYTVDARGYSAWGINIKYYLTGLESTNSNAYARQIVFHSWEKVSETEVYPNGTPEGWGCPAISNQTMKTVDALLKKQRKKVLMWVYN